MMEKDNAETKENGIATAQQFRQAAESQALQEFEAPQRVTLPGSGMAVILRRPRPAYFTLMGFPLPASMAVRIQRGGSEAVKPTPEELVEISNRLVNVFAAAFVSPKLSLDPGPDEISPNWLVQEDMSFLYRFLVGEVLSGGQDLAESFREPAGGDAGRGANGGAVGVSTEPVAIRVDG